jgi:uncharacterized protein (DUF1330 family)
MPNVLVRQKVKDYDSWRAVFFQHGDSRASSGSQGATVFRNAHDPNELEVLFDWDDLGQARQFFQSEEWRQSLQQAGVTEPTTIIFLEEVERLSE